MSALLKKDEASIRSMVRLVALQVPQGHLVAYCVGMLNSPNFLSVCSVTLLRLGRVHVTSVLNILQRRAARAVFLHEFFN